MNEVFDKDRLGWERSRTGAEQAEGMLVSDPAQRYEPFPLTDVQRAYWVGRGGYFELGNTGCHVYIEISLPGVDRARLQAAWQKLIDRHEMLRAVIRDDGLQHILPTTPHYEIKHVNMRGLDPAKAQLETDSLRRRMSHQVFAPDRWPMFELRTSDPNGVVVLHLSCDLMFVDFWSMQLILGEFVQLSFDPDPYLAPLQISFRDYILGAARYVDAGAYKRAEEYWRRRLDTLPAPPKLPLAKSPSAITQPRFVRRGATLDKEAWRSLKNRSAKARITPSGLMMAAFARVLAAWSQSPSFTLNLTLFNRAPLHPEVYKLVGDFTSILLLEIQEDPRDSFEVLARRIATQFWSDLEHRDYGGLQVLQEIARRGDPDRPAMMPVVFTSALAQSMPGLQPTEGVGDLIYGISQTPQVWLDHQVYERGGQLHITWDAVEELFPPGLLDNMFATYWAYLQRLIHDEAAWSETNVDLLPRAQVAQRAAMNDTAAPAPSGFLHSPFLEQARKRPQQVAVVTSERNLTYHDVHRCARSLARRLRELGAGPNRLVAVVMEKGWEQVVAAIAILEAGGAYLPIDPDLPRERRWLLLKRGEVEVVLTQPRLAERLEWPSGQQCLSVDWQGFADADTSDDAPLAPTQKETDLAYVIFTSGSTGAPKGVMVEHRSALNTVLDINDRFDVSADDRILALSSLSFDLSVYDIFGALAAGATIVFPPATSSREPGDWAALVLREQVTIWNSVPALLELLVDHVGTRKELIGSSLRLALLSGDWIPVSLPDRARVLLPGLQVVSLGGATEASIWSIFYPVDKVGEDWRSIPYGRPLRNQQMHVLNEAMHPCPVWVPGQIYISGIGLARGYWRDETKTEAQFLTHPETSERLYRTGDVGRYLPDGDIEFLGREDDQVKVQGFRIELGEIETVLERHPKVKSAVVAALGERTGPKRLVAYVVGHAVTEEELAKYLREKLPDYMVPTMWQKLDALPLTPNGKVNRKALPRPVLPEARPAAAADQAGDQNDALTRITGLIGEELGLPSLDPQRNLLTVGATSMDLVRIVGRLEKEFGFRPSFQEFLRDPSAGALARLFQQRSGGAGAAAAGAAAPPRRGFELMIDPAAREAFKRESHGIRVFAPDWGRMPLTNGEFPAGLEEGVRRRRATRNFLAEPVPLDALSAWLAELRRTTLDGKAKYAYGSAGGLYPVQTYLHAKPDGIVDCPPGTFYYHPVEHALVPITLGAELSPDIHEPFTNRGTFEQARFSLFFVSHPRAIEPVYGDLAPRFSLLEAGAMAHALEASAWRFGIGVCPIGWLDFSAIRDLLQLEDGQELLHAHIGGLAETSSDSEDREEGVI